MATLLFHIKGPSFLILLLFIQHGLAQNPFGNLFGGQFSGEGFISDQGHRQNGFFQRFPFFSFNNIPTPHDDDRDNDTSKDEKSKAAPGASTPADNSDKNVQFDPNATPDLPTNFKGKWDIVSKNSGVSAMHIILLPNNKVIMYDASAFRISDIKLPNGECVPFKDKNTNKELQDCWSHGVEFDVFNKAKIRPLKVFQKIIILYHHSYTYIYNRNSNTRAHNFFTKFTS